MSSLARALLLIALASFGLASPAQAQPETPSAGSAVCDAETPGCFLDRDGSFRVAADAYDALIIPDDRHYGRAALEELLFIGIGATWYFLDESNEADWDRPSWKARFTREVIRLDTNTFEINFLWHPLSGAAYYGLPRANGLGVAAAAAYGLGASVLWEYGLEFNEKISLNDLVTTPVTGVALGEFFARLARYLNRAPGGGRKIHRAFGWTLGFSQAIHDAMDRAPGLASDVPADNLGFDASIAHRFTWRVGAAFIRGDDGAETRSSGLGEALLEGRLVAIPGYLRPGRFHSYFGDANVTRMRMRVSAGSVGAGFDMDADTVVLGYFGQRVRREAGATRGYAIIAGTSVGYGYRKDSLGNFDDRVSAARLPGLALDIDAITPRAAFHVSARVHGELAGVHAASFDGWRSAHPDERTKGVLEREGYYYGWGFSESLRARVEVTRFALESTISHAFYDSHDGLDRHQESITLDVDATDRVIDAELLARVEVLPRLGLFVELGGSWRARRSRLGELTLDRHLRRGFLRLGQVF